MNSNVHVLPVNDLKRHFERTTCHCSPRIQEETNGKVVIHNAFDGREFYQDGIDVDRLAERAPWLVKGD